MTYDQRQYRRLAKPLEARWRGASVGSICRIADISWGGCFVQTPAEPAIGEHTVVTATIGSREVTLAGSVVYREPPIGFAIRFDPMSAEQIDVLKEMLGEPPEKPS
jgi:hypothetical protein